MKRQNLLYGLLVVLLLLPVVLFMLIGKDLLVSAYKGQSPEWLNFIIDSFYPRFWSEKNRLNLPFFIKKANQVAIRYVLVVATTLVGFYLYRSSDRAKSFLEGFSSEKTNVHNTLFLRVLFFLIFLIATRNVYEDLRALRHLEEFYTPVFILDIFNLPFPDKTISFLLYAFLFLSLILVIFGIKQKVFSVIAALLFILYQGYLYSFEKVDHGYAPFTYAAILFPFLIHERLKCKKDRKETFKSWPLRLIMIVTALVYFVAGLEKLLIAGLDWASPTTFKSYLLMHPTEAGKWVADSDILSFLLPVAALLFQLSFPLILFFKRLKWVILTSGVLFHLGTVVLFGISSYENPWLFNYIFFIDWTKPGVKISGWPAYFRS